jgi:predicted RNA binding protein YcfA (HicA-like mRNA interferase family)
MPDVPPVTGPQLARLLLADGWEQREKRARHGIDLRKRFSDRTRVTLVPTDSRQPLPDGTLAAILSPRQTGLTKAGLGELIEKHGLR